MHREQCSQVSLNWLISPGYCLDISLKTDHMMQIHAVIFSECLFYFYIIIYMRKFHTHMINLNATNCIHAAKIQ